ncbi:MAG: hypothetical protein ABEI06_03540 [Halobacteriaceae archaeon]
MALGSGVIFVIFLNILLLIFAIGGFLYIYFNTQSSEEPDAEEWYEETMDLVQEVEQAATIDKPRVDRRDIQRQTISLSTKIKSQVRSAPSDIDEQLIMDLHQLGIDCYKIGMEHTEMYAAQTGTFLEEELEELKLSAQQLERKTSSKL